MNNSVKEAFGEISISYSKTDNDTAFMKNILPSSVEALILKTF